MESAKSILHKVNYETPQVHWITCGRRRLKGLDRCGQSYRFNYAIYRNSWIVLCSSICGWVEILYSPFKTYCSKLRRVHIYFVPTYSGSLNLYDCTLCKIKSVIVELNQQNRYWIKWIMRCRKYIELRRLKSELQRYRGGLSYRFIYAIHWNKKDTRFCFVQKLWMVEGLYLDSADEHPADNTVYIFINYTWGPSAWLLGDTKKHPPACGNARDSTMAILILVHTYKYSCLSVFLVVITLIIYSPSFYSMF
jgi:mRNA-degrading endonuclease RelE of RelBE toxin-antitoxin system